MHRQPEPQLAADPGANLRPRAEAALLQSVQHLTANTTDLSPQATQRLLHELQVHQIELEMQNEELRRAQAALGMARANYFDFYDLAPVGYCTTSGKGLISQANISMASLLGLTRATLPGQDLSHFVLADDHDSFYFFRQELLATGESLTCELRLMHTKGTSFWVSLAALAVPDDAGNTELRMVVSDISARKQAEGKLQLAASVFKHTSQGILITDAQSNIIEVNEAFSRITGYSRDEALGHNPRLLGSGHQDAAFFTDLWHTLNSLGHWSGEIRNRRKNGELYVELMSISVVRDFQGAVQRYMGQFTDHTEIRSHQQHIERMAYYDVLTGLPNRVLNADRLQQSMALARRSGRMLAVVYIDLDGFKAINDAHGHAVGDQVLISVARHMQAVMREGDTLARVGGDEFAAVLTNLDNVAACLPLLARLLAAAAETLQLGAHALQVSASLGATFYPQSSELDGDQLLRQADQAMYQAKQAGKSCYQLFDAAQDISLSGWHDD